MSFVRVSLAVLFSTLLLPATPTILAVDDQENARIRRAAARDQFIAQQEPVQNLQQQIGR